MYKIVALFGKSGAGKDYIQKWLCGESSLSANTNSIVSHTTRPQRDNEEDGVAYHFVSESEFTSKLLNNDFLEVTAFNDWFYGTSIESLKEDKLNIGVFNIIGVQCLLQDPRCEVLPIYIDASNKTRLLRALNREQNPNCSEVCRRFLADEKDFAEIDFSYASWTNIDNCPLSGLDNFIKSSFED